MLPLHPVLKKAYWGLAGVGALYAAIMLALTNVTIQRNALYANNFVSAWWADVDTPQAYGFAKNQVTPFNVTTPDNEILYAWHVLPLNIYEKHEAELFQVASGSPNGDFTQTKAFELLKNDPKARLIINFHGNAGHVAQGWRTETYRTLTSLPNTHLLTIDYRGFGRSSGTATEAGLITDGIALVNYALHTLNIPSSRITVVGQSLGTAVASAVGLHFADPLGITGLLPSNTSTTTGTTGPTDFAAIILIAPFTSLPTLLESYRIFGLIPVLSPLRGYPRLQNWLRARIVDAWPTLSRIEALVSSSAAAASQKSGGAGKKLRLHILHAKDDFDIPWAHGVSIYEAASAMLATAEGGKAVVKDTHVPADGAKGRTARVRSTASVDGAVEVRMDLLAYGGHNRVVTFAPVALAVQRAFDASP
ncbi:Alpha/Beta hydrolase protein [Macrophomina phaseolina]|uniref:Alpha/Beta hydrolase protein n=1 Tax=Macrophomina phaseolina TaxID=35725 RepID=A0ABQ8GCR1_9PEZI|nr:Alpha/Beta hydrolase protein [Macrophomina phaseolina]